eukprot:5339008-Amphidinium_carterae.3
MWENGEVEELAHRLVAQQDGMNGRRSVTKKPDSSKQRRQVAQWVRHLVKQGAVSKAVQGLVGGVAQDSVDDRPIIVVHGRPH